jgi:tetratricopeptide (TPR) repeat protein
LRASLNLVIKLIDSGRGQASSLMTWENEPALASVRDPGALAKLPKTESEQWRRFWMVVAAEIVTDPVTRARERASQRDWAGAASLYAQSLARGPINDGHFWFEYAAVDLLSGDRAGYATACRELMQRCGKPGGPRTYLAARAGTLAADGAPDASLLGRLAHDELQQNATQFWSLTEQGALAYRGGRFEDSVSLFEQSLKADSHPGRAVVNWAWLALAQQRLGKTEEARRWLEKAQAWLDQYREGIPPRAEQELGLHLHNWLEANVLRREAEAPLSSK